VHSQAILKNDRGIVLCSCDRTAFFGYDIEKISVSVIAVLYELAESCDVHICSDYVYRLFMLLLVSYF